MLNAECRMLNRANGGRLRSAFSIQHSTLCERGFTFVELLVVTTILLILASAVMPLARVTMQRQREAELRKRRAEALPGPWARRVGPEQGRQRVPSV